MRVFGVLALQSADTTPPTIPSGFIASAVNRTSVQLNWGASTDNIGVTGYQIFRNGVPLITTIATSYLDTTGQPSTTYTYAVSAFDAAGNSSGQTSAQVTTPANSAPVWSNVPAQSLTTNQSYSFSLASFANDADTDVLTYSVVSGSLPAGIALNASTGLLAGVPTTVSTGSVTFEITDGFATADKAVSFTVKNADTTAPPVPTGLAAASISSSQIDLSWNASVDAGPGTDYVTGTQDYRLYRSTDGVSYGLRTTVTGTSYSDTGLSASTQYNYKVAARDVALNESAQSAAVTTTTQSSTDGVTISGSGSSMVVTINRAAGGLTAKATAAPLFYNNFEARNVGDSTTACGLTAVLDSTSVTVANNRSYTGTKSLLGIYPANRDSFPEVAVQPPGGSLQICISAWVYWEYTSSYSSNPIFKLCRAGSNNNGGLYHGRPQFYQTARPGSDGSITGGDWGYVTDSGVVAVSNAVYNIGTPQPGPHAGQWNFIQYKYQLNNPASGTNGQCIMLCNGKSIFPQPVVNQAGGALTYGKMRDSSSTALIDWGIVFFDGISSSAGVQPGINMNVDELYFDTALNEVVVTDNAVYSSSTKFLDLICSVATDTQIVGGNTALSTLFPTGSTANFHIFNSSGNEVVSYSKVMP